MYASRNDNLLYWINKKNETHEKYRGTRIELNDSEKIKKIESKYNQNELIMDSEKKSKKIFLDSSPRRQPAQKGEGVYESKI